MVPHRQRLCAYQCSNVHTLTLQVDQPSRNGATPLWVACQGGYAGCTAMLLASGARVDAPMRNGGTPLLVAVFANQPACVRQLLAAVRAAPGLVPMPRAYACPAI